MVNVVNNPPPRDEGSGLGMIIGVVVVLIIVALFFIYALPAIRDRGGTNINVPDDINIDVDGNLPNQ